jgi:hypothetical protein
VQFLTFVNADFAILRHIFLGCLFSTKLQHYGRFSRRVVISYVVTSTSICTE